MIIVLRFIWFTNGLHNLNDEKKLKIGLLMEIKFLFFFELYLGLLRRVSSPERRGALLNTIQLYSSYPLQLSVFKSWLLLRFFRGLDDCIKKSKSWQAKCPFNFDLEFRWSIHFRINSKYTFVRDWEKPNFYFIQSVFPEWSCSYKLVNYLIANFLIFSLRFSFSPDEGTRKYIDHPNCNSTLKVCLPADCKPRETNKIHYYWWANKQSSNHWTEIKNILKTENCITDEDLIFVF